VQYTTAQVLNHNTTTTLLHRLNSLFPGHSG